MHTVGMCAGVMVGGHDALEPYDVRTQSSAYAHRRFAVGAVLAAMGTMRLQGVQRGSLTRLLALLQT